MLTFQQIADILDGEVLSFKQNSSINNFVFDSRILFNPVDSIFIAITGNHHDGHNYIENLSKSDVKNFIVEKKIPAPGDSNVILVNNSIKALQQLAAYHRSRLSIPVIGITGSNGKTIIKEWLGQVLGQKYQLTKSPKSYNSQLGVPLSVLMLKESDEVGIFEAGISMPGEMAILKDIIKPTIGIFTNIGPAHDKGFLNREEKAKEKWELFKGSAYVIYCKDHPLIDQTKPKAIKGFTWGKSIESDVLILSEQKENKGTLLKLIFDGMEYLLELPFKERAYVENAMHIVACCFSMGFDFDFIQSSIQGLRGVPMRLEVKDGINQCILIDDTYNNDLAGVTSAIEFLGNHNFGKKKTLIISDLLSSGIRENYDELSKLIENSQIDRVIGVGNQIQSGCKTLEINKTFFNSTDELLAELDNIEFQNEAILIKGARPFEFEKITHKLSRKIHGTKLEINLHALVNNLNFYKSLLKPGVKIMVMVKAFGYGSGSVEIANLLEYHKVDYLAVAYPDEGVELRKQGISIPVMVMNVDSDAFDKIAEYRLEPEIVSLEQLKELNKYIQSSGKNIPVHIKIDTGMKRLGFESNDIRELTEYLAIEKQIKVASIFTHLAGSDEEEHNEFSNFQLNSFEELSGTIIKTIGYKPILHALNSPGIIRFTDRQFDMVRLGIGLYGYESCGLMQYKLEPVSELKTVITQIRKVSAGETIGYGRKGVAHEDLTIATIAIGYADGFRRAFSNGKASVLVNGKRAPVIGNICMDMTMIDITGISAEVGDDVIIFGREPTIRELAEAIGTIPYEILTSVSDRVKRVYISE